jgi:cell division protein FtsN
MIANFRPAYLPRQRGNTLTGIIIGLIVGLAIAVAVALAITKGASPFTDKAVKTGRPADPQPGQAADPNKPMYGNREAVREANRELQEKTSPRPASAPAPADADPLGAAIANMKEPAQHDAPRPADSSHRLAVPAAPAAAPAAASAAGGDGSVYYLQAGAFRELGDAENTKAKLALLGFEASISDRTSDSGVLHRVRMGPYGQVEAANKARAKLLDNGVDVALVRTQK